MTPETLLTAALSASTPLFALVAARIYPGAFPEKTPYPGIVYSRAGTEFISTIHGTLVAEDADFSVQAWAATRTAANAVADAAVSALVVAGYIPSSRGDIADDETGLEGVEIKVTVLHNY